MKRLIVSLLLSAGLLSACGDSASEGSGDGTEQAGAQGDIAGGSINDGMIPLGELKSQSPPLRESSSASGDSAAGDDEDSESADGNEGGGG